MLLLLRSLLTLLWCSLLTLWWRSRLLTLGLRRWLALLLWRRRLALLLLRGSLTLLWRRRLALLLLRGSLTLLLWRRLALLLLRRSLTLLWRRRLALLLLRGSLTLFWRSLLALLLLRGNLTLLRRSLLALWLRSGLALLRLLNCLTLRLRISLVLLELRDRLIACRYCRWGLYVAIGSKRPADGYAGGAAMIHIGKLGSIGSGGVFILHLGLHGRGVRFAEGCQFLRSRPRLDAARSAVEADPVCGFIDAVFVNVMNDVDVHVVDGAVVAEVATVPVSALIAETDIAETVVDVAVESDVPSPIAAVEAITATRVTPIAGRP